MGVACEKLIIDFIRSAPPTGVLVKTVFLGAHYIERNHLHHAVGHKGTGIGGAIISCSDKRIDKGSVVFTLTGKSGCRTSNRENGQCSKEIHLYLVLIFFGNMMQK